MRRRNFEGPLDEGKNIPRMMEDGVFYDLEPPAKVPRGEFHRVRCVYRVPNHPNEYVVEGIPEGGSKPEQFVLRFTDRGVRAKLSDEQEGFDTSDSTPPPTRPQLRLIK